MYVIKTTKMVIGWSRKTAIQTPTTLFHTIFSTCKFEITPRVVILSWQLLNTKCTSIHFGHIKGINDELSVSFDNTLVCESIRWERRCHFMETDGQLLNTKAFPRYRTTCLIILTQAYH